jgi:hypothetical protein
MSTTIVVVPMSGSRATSTTNGMTMIQNGTVPREKLSDLGAARRQPVGQVDDERQLGDFGGVDLEERAELDPARSAVGGDADPGDQTATSSTRDPTAMIRLTLRR